MKSADVSCAVRINPDTWDSFLHCSSSNTSGQCSHFLLVYISTWTCTNFSTGVHGYQMMNPVGRCACTKLCLTQPLTTTTTTNDFRPVGLLLTAMYLWRLGELLLPTVIIIAPSQSFTLPFHFFTHYIHNIVTVSVCFRPHYRGSEEIHH